MNTQVTVNEKLVDVTYVTSHLTNSRGRFGFRIDFN